MKPEYKALSIDQASKLIEWLRTVEDDKIYLWAAAFGHPITVSGKILEVPEPLTNDPIAERLFQDVRTLVAAEQQQRMRNAKARAQAAEWRTLAQQMEDEDAPQELSDVWTTIIFAMYPRR